ncbi:MULTISPECIES: TetR/AcrR family transcriptional regulator [unclassified Nocardioides]|uniref:TetR/AcrR family transcriptional regulator n=1 Tax=unclassified Nocardioides TaxID=2615069 RepID=UPI0030148598
MARYDAIHKKATRARILETAGRRLKRDGIDGTGVAILMKDAGLTNGAFYAHFDSKEDLVAHVVTEELRGQQERFAALGPGSDGLGVLLGQYLSPGHRDAPSEGCPSAALLDEIARCSPTTRTAYTAGVLDIVTEIGARLDRDPDDRETRSLVLAVYALLIGAIQLSRALTDTDLAAGVLDQAKRQAERMLGL